MPQKSHPAPAWKIAMTTLVPLSSPVANLKAPSMDRKIPKSVAFMMALLLDLLQNAFPWTARALLQHQAEKAA